MPIVVNTNTSATTASFNLSRANDALRKSLASERGIPPYLICNDRTLIALATERPTDRAELLEIPGIGEKKASDLGPIFLKAIAEA